MITIKKGSEVTITLDQSLESGKTITLSIFDEFGEPLKKADNAEIKEIPLAFNSTTNKYEVALTIHADTPDQFIRLYYDSTDAVIEDIYQPEDAVIKSMVLGQQIVPVSYFVDWVLASDYKDDPSYKNAVDGYVKNNRQGVEKYLASAIDKLEKKTKLFFAERTITSEKKDYFFDRFNMHLWQFAVHHPPINELVKFELYYANNPIADISPSLFVHDREMGLIEFLPLPGGESSGLYTLLLSNLSGTALTVLSHSNLDRVPCMFRATYKTGLFYKGADQTEKDGLRSLICKKALRDIMPIIDPATRTPSRSEGIDGVSASISYGNDRLMQVLKEEEDEYCNDLRLKYGRDIDMVIV